jgi:hypothetical protein
MTEDLVLRFLQGALVLIAIVATTLARAEDDFPITGTYLKDMACKGDGSQRPDLLVTITSKRIESSMGVCSILSRKRTGRAIAVQVECKVSGDQLILGDVTFTIRDENTVEFEDQDHTSDGMLHRCGG